MPQLAQLKHLTYRSTNTPHYQSYSVDILHVLQEVFGQSQYLVSGVCFLYRQRGYVNPEGR